MNLSFIKVRPTQSVNVSQIKQALLLPIVCPSTLGYTLYNEGVWRDEGGYTFSPLNHNAVAVAIADDDYIGGLRVQYKLPQGNARYITIDEWVSNDITDDDNRLLIIELENECVVEVIDMQFIANLSQDSFEWQRLKQFGFLS